MVLAEVVDIDKVSFCGPVSKFDFGCNDDVVESICGGFAVTEGTGVETWGWFSSLGATTGTGGRADTGCTGRGPEMGGMGGMAGATAMGGGAGTCGTCGTCGATGGMGGIPMTPGTGCKPCKPGMRVRGTVCMGMTGVCVG